MFQWCNAGARFPGGAGQVNTVYILAFELYVRAFNTAKQGEMGRDQTNLKGCLIKKHFLQDLSFIMWLVNHFGRFKPERLSKEPF